MRVVQFKLKFTSEAIKTFQELEKTDLKKHKKIRKTLGLLSTNIRHPSLNTHVYHSLSGSNGEKVFEAYVENKTSAAFRVFWHYGPTQGEITILAITPHP